MAPYANPPPPGIPAFPASSSRPLKHLTPDRWFRRFDASLGTLVTIDIAVARDEDVVSLAGRLRELAGEARGNVKLNVSVLEEFSTAWICALADLSRICQELGGSLSMEGMCPRARDVLEDTRKLHSGTMRRRNEKRGCGPCKAVGCSAPRRFGITT